MDYNSFWSRGTLGGLIGLNRERLSNPFHKGPKLAGRVSTHLENLENCWRDPAMENGMFWNKSQKCP